MAWRSSGYSHGTATGSLWVLMPVRLWIIKCEQNANDYLIMFFLQNQLILGVMGVDIAINEIKRKTPTYRVSMLYIKYHSHISFTLMGIESHHSHCLCAAWSQRLYLRHWPEWLRTAASQPAAQSRSTMNAAPYLMSLTSFWFWSQIWACLSCWLKLTPLHRLPLLSLSCSDH